MKKRLLIILLLLLMDPSRGISADVTSTWSGVGSWSYPTHWSSNPEIPNNILDGTTFDAVINTGTVLSDVSGVTVDNLIINGGLIGGTEQITVLAGGSWNSERIFNSGGILFDTGATFDISGSNPKSMDDNTGFTVLGTVNLTGTGSVRAVDDSSNGVAIIVESGGVFDFQSDADIIGEFGASLLRKGTITNAGTWKKSSGSGISLIDGNWSFSNTGTVLVESGTLRFNNYSFGNTFNNDRLAEVQAGNLVIGAGTSTGNFDIHTGGALVVETPLSVKQTFSGAQLVNNGMLTLKGNTSFIDSVSYTGPGSVSIESGTLSGDVPLSIQDLTWIGGDLANTGGVSIVAGGSLSVSGNSDKHLRNNAILDIQGAATVTSSKNIDSLATIGNEANINIAASTGLLDFQTNVGLSDGFNGNNPNQTAGVLNIEGTLRKSNSTGVSAVEDNWQVNNTGTIEVLSGTLRFKGSILHEGLVNADGGNVEFDGAVTGSGGFAGGGTTTFSGLYSPGEGANEIDFPGPVVFGSASQLTIEIGGTTAGTDFDSLVIDETVSLNGILNVSLTNGFVPSQGDSFEIINAAGGLGGSAFSFSILPSLSNPENSWKIIYGENSLVLSVVNYAEADFNEDGSVDENDLMIWQNGYGSSNNVSKGQGDGNSDGYIDGKDFLLWQQQYSSSNSNVANMAVVPEPVSAILVLESAAWFICSRYCRFLMGR